MLMTVDELKAYIDTDELEPALIARLDALELLIRKYTNNNFQDRGFRVRASIRCGTFMATGAVPFAPGDTIMVSQSRLMQGRLFTVRGVSEKTFSVNESACDEAGVLVTKVEYPSDIKLGAANIIGWQIKNAAAGSGDLSKREIQSETLSRYSVTYATDVTESDMDAFFGVPKKYVSFLRLYRKARF